MILVMLGHTTFPLLPLIYVFHVPLFFFLSGYLFNAQQYCNPVTLVRARFKRLLVPYLAFATFNGAIWIVLNHLAPSEWPHILAAPLVAIRHTPWTRHMGPFWFLACLFATEVLYCSLCTLKDSAIRLVALCSFVVAGFLYALRFSVLLPWSVDAALVALLFFAAGHFIKTLPSHKATWWTICVAVIGVVIGVINGLSISDQGANMALNLYGNPALFTLGALSGIYCFVIIVQRLPSLRPIEFIGQYSIAYLCLHQFPVYPLLHPHSAAAAEIPHAMPGASFSLFGSVAHSGLSILHVALATVVITPAVLALRRYAPFVLGARAS